MLNFKRSMALLLAVCMIMGFVLIGRPVVANAETYDPYVYVYEPDLSDVPAYYHKYAKAFAGWSPHMVAPDSEYVWLFNLVNMGELIEDQAAAPSGAYASVSAFCSDLFTDDIFGSRYRRIELEDARFDAEGNTSDNAQHLRAIVANAMPYLADPEVVQEAANAYLANVDGSVVKSLTGSELASAIQAAIWYYSDEDEFAFEHFNPVYFALDNPYFGTVDYYDTSHAGKISKIMDLTSPLDFDEEFSYPRTSDNVYGVYRYLRSLAPQKAQDVLIPENAISMESAVVMGSGSNCTMNLTVSIDGTIDADDELVLTAKCGSQTKSFQLGKTTTAEKVGEGLYAFSFTGVSVADCASVELELSGTQSVTGAYYLEAEPVGGNSAKESSQAMVAYFNASAAPVQAKTTVKPLTNAVTTELTKVDARTSNPLSGVAFDLYMKQSGGDVKVGSFTTDENGKISVVVTDATAEYYFVETTALPGYKAITGAVSGGRVTNDWDTGSLEITKILSNENDVQVGQTFTFDVTLDLSKAAVAGNDLSWMTDEYFKSLLTCSKAISWSVAQTRKLTATVTLDAGETVTIDGIPLGTAYTVKEVLSADEQKLFDVTTKVDGKAVQSGTASGSVGGEHAVVFTNTVVADDLRYGELSVSKKLVNTTPAVPGEVFKFKITIDLPTESVKDALPWVDDAYLLGKITCDKDLTWTAEDGKYTAAFEVKLDEVVSIDGLVYGTTYTVEEDLTDDEQKLFSVTATVDGTNQDDAIASGAVKGDHAVVFTNTVVADNLRYGELSVSKKLVNTTPAVPGEVFKFKITIDLPTETVKDALPWVDDAYLLGKITCDKDLTWTAEDGKYTAAFEVKVDEVVSIDGLVYGTTYTVEEDLTDDEQKLFSVTATVDGTNQDDAIASGAVKGDHAVVFTNTVVADDLHYGELSVSKKLVNTTPAVPGETFTFEITIELPTEELKNTIPWITDAYLLDRITSGETLTWTADSGKYTATFTVDADETVTIGGLVYGTVYTVKELETEEYRDWYTVTVQIGENEPVDGDTASGSIAEKNALIFTNSVVADGVKYGQLSVSKKLVNTTPAVPGETFTFEITIELPTEELKNTIPWITDAYLLDRITSGETLTWTADSGKYTAIFTVDADETVTIGGLVYGTVYTVKELETEEYRDWYTVTVQIGENEPVDGDTASGSIAEKNALIFTNSVVADGVKYGQLSVSKKLVNTTPAVPGEVFKFKITVELPTEKWQATTPWIDEAYLLDQITSHENLTWTAADGKFSTVIEVNVDETVTLSGIAQGTVYTIEELLTDGEKALYNVTAMVDGTDQTEIIVSGAVEETHEVVFTNTVVTADVQVGELSVSKKLVNTTPAAPGETFNFKLTIDLSTADAYIDAVPWMNDEYLMGLITSSEELTWTAEDGKYTAEFTVDVDETVTIGGIAQGTIYTLEEVQTEEDRKWYTVTTQIGENEPEDGNTAEGTVAAENALIFTNTVVTADVPVGQLSVSKELINTTPAQPEETFNFKITIQLPTEAWKEIIPWIDDNYLLGKIVSDEELTWTAEDGKYTAVFTVDAGETVTIGGLAQGTAYTVEEIRTEEDRKWFTVTSKVDDNDATDSAIAEGSIAAENAVVFTNSVVTAEVELGKLEVSKKLINAAAAQEGEIFNFSIVVDFSSASVYADTTPWMNDGYLLSLVTASKELTWTENEDGTYTATFTLKADEAITIEGLAVGTGYTLREELTAEDRKVYEVTTQIATDGTVAEANKGYEANGSIAAQNAVRFTNEFVPSDGPDTGDAGIGMPLLLGVVSILGAAVLALKRRRFVG